MDPTKPIIKWAPTVGLWNTSTDNPVYLGPEEITRQPYGRPFGLLVSGVWFQEGKVEVTVVLPKADDGGVAPSACGGFLFGYRSEHDEYRFFTLGGWGYAFALGRFGPESGSWSGISTVGSLKNLRPEKPYILSVRIQGERVTAEVDGVELLPPTLDSAPLRGRLGLYAWGSGGVEFRAASITEEAGQRSTIDELNDILKHGELSSQDVAIIEAELPNLVEDTPKTQGSSTKVMRVLAKLSKPLYDISVKVITDVASETARKTFFGS